MRARVALIASLLAAGAWLSTVPAAGTPSVTTCGYVHASVPYTRQGNTERWRVYVTGASSCASATKVLNAVLHLQARPHVGSSEVNSYFTDSGWLCPFGDMGAQTCELPTRLPAHPPIRARAIALDCAVRSCPAHLPFRDI
jgi:hypothetical protein